MLWYSFIPKGVKLSILNLDNLPHVCNIYSNQISLLTDNTKRIKSSGYTLSYSLVSTWAEPMEGDEKISVGIKYDTEAIRFWFKVDAIGSTSKDDVIVCNSKAYNIVTILNYDVGPEDVQHIEVIAELLPTKPSGIS